MTSLVRPWAGESGSREEIRTRPRRYDIRRVGVLGAGTMGARIAAHVANAGIPVLLLDLAAATPNRNAVATQALEGLKKAKPPAFADAGAAGRHPRRPSSRGAGGRSSRASGRRDP